MEIQEDKWKVDFWSIFFSVISLIFGNFAYFFPQQRILFITLLMITIALGIIFFYARKIDSNEKSISFIKNELSTIRKDITEKFNYLKEIYNIKVDVEMLKRKNKRGQINILDIIKILIAIILLYVVFETIKSLPK